MYFTSLIITIISAMMYHVFLKKISPDVNPFISLIVTYLGAIIISIVLYFIFPGSKNGLPVFNNLNCYSYLLGIPIVGVEVGYLLIYRTGWPLAIASPLITTITSAFLLLISIFIFKDDISTYKILGICFCVIGVVFISISK